MLQPVFQRETQQKINRLHRFFTREEAGGFIFAVAEDQRMISSINRELIALGEQNGKKIKLVFLDEKSGTPLLEQFRRAAATDAQGLIIGNLDSLFPQTGLTEKKKPEQDFLTELNFGREALYRLGKPLLFWVSHSNFSILQHRAADLFTQRAASTVFFDLELEGAEMNDLKTDIALPERTTMPDEVSRKSALDKVSLLLKQLRTAEKSNQPRRRIANDIALPLAEELAKLDDPQAVELLDEYAPDFDAQDAQTLLQRGRAYKLANQIVKAEPLLRKAVELFESQAQPFNLSTALIDLGDIWKIKGQLPEALNCFERSIKVAEVLTKEQPENQDFKNKAAIAYERLGSTHTALGNLPQALIFFEKDIELSAALHESYPQNVEFKNGLAISYAKLGSTHTALGNLPQALTFFEERSRLGKELHETYPQNVEFKNGLAISYQYLGNTHAALGNLPQALTFFEQFNQLMKELHESYPQNVSFKNGLAVSYSKLGTFYRDEMNDPAKAKPYLQQCHDIWNELSEQFPDYKAFKDNYEWAKAQLNH